MKLKIITAIYGFLIGAAMVTTWVAMLASGKGASVGLELGFHIAAELATAAFMILAGVLILKKSAVQRRWAYLALGMLLPATLGAFVEYIVGLQWLISLSSAGTFVITLVLVILNYEKLRDLTFLSIGVMLYSSLNIFGEALESVVQGQVSQPLWGTLAYISLAFVAATVLVTAKLASKE